MEDSGIDSEDKISVNNYNDLSQIETSKDSENENCNSRNFDVIFKIGKDGNTSYQPVNCGDSSTQFTSCRILQRKLELKVERAKRNLDQFQESQCCKKSSTLIPIDRLQIPRYSDNQPLVDYKSDSEDTEEISFFPIKTKSVKKNHNLSDTFSIQEMTIESDNTEDSESQNLELLPPPSNNKILDKLFNCFYCREISK